MRVRVTGRSLGDRARVFLIGDHENDDLCGLVFRDTEWTAVGGS
jgi:hypothetical protein